MLRQHVRIAAVLDAIIGNDICSTRLGPKFLGERRHRDAAASGSFTVTG
ncbi:hypothetical protein [Herbiconiux daphne]|nr:hypothetical protein [Herbiconiux daphne]